MFLQWNAVALWAWGKFASFVLLIILQLLAVIVNYSTIIADTVTFSFNCLLYFWCNHMHVCLLFALFNK